MASPHDGQKLPGGYYFCCTYLIQMRMFVYPVCRRFYWTKQKKKTLTDRNMIGCRKYLFSSVFFLVWPFSLRAFLAFGALISLSNKLSSTLQPSASPECQAWMQRFLKCTSWEKAEKVYHTYVLIGRNAKSKHWRTETWLVAVNICLLIIFIQCSIWCIWYFRCQSGTNKRQKHCRIIFWLVILALM